MSLFKISEKLKNMGLNQGQVDVILDMVREFALSYARRIF